MDTHFTLGRGKRVFRLHPSMRQFLKYLLGLTPISGCTAFPLSQLGLFLISLSFLRCSFPQLPITLNPVWTCIHSLLPQALPACLSVPSPLFSYVFSLPLLYCLTLLLHNPEVSHTRASPEGKSLVFK